MAGVLRGYLGNRHRERTKEGRGILQRQRMELLEALGLVCREPVGTERRHVHDGPALGHDLAKDLVHEGRCQWTKSQTDGRLSGCGRMSGASSCHECRDGSPGACHAASTTASCMSRAALVSMARFRSRVPSAPLVFGPGRRAKVPPRAQTRRRTKGRGLPGPIIPRDPHAGDRKRHQVLPALPLARLLGHRDLDVAEGRSAIREDADVRAVDGECDARSKALHVIDVEDHDLVLADQLHVVG